MNWTWIVGGLGATALVVAALYFFGVTAVVKLIGDVVRFVAETISAFLAWLKKPGSKLKAVCAVLAFMSLTFGIQSMNRGYTIVHQQEAYTLLEQKKATELAALATELSLRDQRIEEFRELARQQIALLDAQKLENKALVAEAAAARAAAAKSAAAFQREFDSKPPECAAALEVMANACSTLKDY